MKFKVPFKVGVHTSQVFLQFTLIQLPTIPASLQSLTCGSHNSGILSSHFGHPLPYGFVLGVIPSSQQPYIVFKQSPWWPGAPESYRMMILYLKNKSISISQCFQRKCQVKISQISYWQILNLTKTVKF